MSRKFDKSPLSRVTGGQPAIRHITAAYTAEPTDDDANETVVVEEAKAPVAVNSEPEPALVNESVNTSVDGNKDAINKFIAKNRKAKFEDTHRKDTFWLENNLLTTLRQVTSGSKGLKTTIINESLKAYFKKHGIQILDEE